MAIAKGVSLVEYCKNESDTCNGEHLARYSGDSPVVLSTTTANEGFGDDQRMLNAKKTAKFLGYSVATLHRHKGAGLIPSPHRIGGAVRWDKAELEAWIVHGCPNAEAWEAIKQSDRGNFGR